jgi:hypothetical protein
MSSESGRSRRELLRRTVAVSAAAGTSLLAGCSSLGEVVGGGETTIRAYDLPDIDRDAEFESPVAPAVPVTIQPAHLAGARERAVTLLGELPMPLGADEIPNGHVRQEITDAATGAREAVSDALTAQTRLRALQSLQNAREDARYAAAGWTVADRGLTQTDGIPDLRRELAAEHDRAVSDARETRAAHEHVGADLPRAVTIHARIERLLYAAVESDPPREGGANSLLAVAEWGAAAERVDGHLADARHLTEQHRASLGDDPPTVEETIRTAGEQLYETLGSRRTDLPSEPTADEWGIRERVLDDLLFTTGDDTSVADAIGPASAVVDATEQLARFGAVERLQRRVERDGLGRPESAEDVVALRTTAYDALDSALASATVPMLARPVVTEAGWRVIAADRELATLRGDVSVSRLDDAVADYVLATTLARATPAAVQTVRDALDSV